MLPSQPTANDSSASTLPLVSETALPYTRDELGDALGTTSCAIAAITDVQLALAFVKTLGEPEKYADLLQELDERVKRVEKRRAEEKAHRRNVRHGKS